MCLFAEVLHSFLNLELWLNNQVRVIPGQVKLSYRQKVQRNAERFGSQGRVRFLSSWSRPGLIMSGGRPGGSGSGPRSGFGPWFGSVLSASCSAVTVAVVGFFCALVYPILRELRAERVTEGSGTEERLLGFWTILVLAGLVGCVCCVFSWTLTYLDSHQPGGTFPSLLSLHSFRHGPGFNLKAGVAALNGIMAVLTVIWSLS